MRHVRPQTTIFMCLLAGLTAISGCAHEEPWPGNKQDRIVALINAAIGPLDPRLVRDGNTAKVSRLVYRGLYRVRGSDLTAEEDLAHTLHYETEKRACVTLKEGLSFHNGAPLRAGDVAFTIRSAMDPETGASAGGLYRDRFVGIDLPDGADGYKICFDLRAPVATLKTDLVFGILPRNTQTNPSEDPPGTGPYSVFRRDGDRGLVLKRAQKHSQAPNYLIVRTLPDENSRLLAILSSDADLVLNGFSPSVLEILEEQSSQRTGPGDRPQMDRQKPLRRSSRGSKRNASPRTLGARQHGATASLCTRCGRGLPGQSGIPLKAKREAFRARTAHIKRQITTTCGP